MKITKKRSFLFVLFLLSGAILWLLPSEKPQTGQHVKDLEASLTTDRDSAATQKKYGNLPVLSDEEVSRSSGHQRREHPEIPVQEHPVLTAVDRVDRAGEPAPVIPRGRFQRRVLDTPTRTRLEPNFGEPVRVFEQVHTAREDSPFAWDAYTHSAVEAAISHRLFHELATGKTSRLILPLSVEEEVDVNVYEIVHRGDHTFTFMGKIPGDHDNDVILVYNEGAVGGSMTLFDPDFGGARFFQFQVMEEGLIAIKELDDDAFLQQECGGVIMGEALFDGVDETGSGFGDAENSGGDSAGDDPERHLVDIVVGYSMLARQNQGGVAAMESRIIESVDRMNLAFANSQVNNAELVLLGMIEDPEYTESSTSNNSLLEEINGLDSPFSPMFQVVKDLRNALGADKQAFIVNDAQGDAGRAFLPGVSSVTARTYMAPNRITFVHEVGHNWGLAHSWGDSISSFDSNTNAHNYGWRFRSGNTRRRTIQSYDWDWQRVPYFGNPNVIHASLGVPVGAENGYDATGDDRTDSRYVSGGMVGSLGAGFDGSNPNLGARAAATLMARAEERSNILTRAGLGVTHPAPGQEVEIDLTLSLEWVGGAWDDLVDIELLKDGEVVETIGLEIPNQNRVLTWTPTGHPRGNDYQFRLTLNDGEEVSLSEPFTIDPLYPRVVDTFVTPLEIAEPGLEQVSLTFNRAMDPSSFSLTQSITRFTGPDGGDVSDALSHVSWSEGDTVLTVHFDPLNEEGYYRLDIGPALADTRGYLMDQNDNAVPGEPQDGFGFSFRVAVDQAGGVQTLYAEDFDDGHGFTFVGDGWTVGVPNQGSVGGPAAAYSAPNVLGTFLEGNYPNLSQTYSADSASFSTLDASDIRLNFQRFLGLRYDGRGGPGRNRDFARIQYSVNNGAWQNLWVNTDESGGDIIDTNWTPRSYALPAAAANQSNVRLRFQLQTDTADNSFGWNVDDLVVTGEFESLLAPAPAPRVVGHFPEGAVIVSPTSIWLDFDQPMDTSSFSLGDIASFSGPGGDVTATGFAWEADNRLRVDFPPVPEDGLYTMTLGTGVLNTEGAALVATYYATFDLGTFDPPVILTETLPAADVGEPYSAQIAAESAAGLPLTLAVGGRPSWLAFTDHGNGTGTLSGTPPQSSAGSLSLTFSAFDGASTTQENLTLSVRPRARIAFAVESAEVMEDAGFITVAVTRTLNDTGPVSVNYFTEDGNLTDGLNALAGTDYQAASGTLNWADGETGTKTFSVTIFDDDLSQGDRPFMVNLAGVTGIAELAGALMDILIVDDDVDVAPRIVLQDQGTVTHMRATLNAFLEAGSPDTTATLWWGTADGGEAPGSWQHQTPLGGVSYGPLSATMEGLAPETTYFYRFQATNVHGQHQTLTDSFTTREEPDGQLFAITFPGYDREETLVDFPVLVRISEENIPGFEYTNMIFPATGGDLRFYDELETELPFSVQLWNPEGESLIWVRVPALNADTVITMVIADAFTEDLPAYTTDGSAWNANFRAVYHFQGSGSSVPDATSHGFDGTVQNPSATTFVPGIVGSAYDFSGSGSEHISTTATASALNIEGAKPRSTSFWAYTRSFNNGAPFQVGANSSGQMWSLRTMNSTDLWRMQFWGGDKDITVPTQNEWVYLTLVYDGAVSRVYRNGVEVEDSAYSRVLSTSSTSVPLQIGNYNNNNYFNGIVDELRVSDVVRTEDWIWAEWKNMAQTDQFLAFEFLGGGGGGAPVPAPTGVMAEAVSMHQIDLAWNDPTDSAEPADGFRVDRSADGSAWETLVTVAGTAHSDTGLDAASTWYYRVITLRDGQQSLPSATVSATTDAPPAAPVIHFTRPLDGVAAIPSGVGLWVIASVELDPAVSSVDLQWTVVEGPGEVTFTRPQEATTGATFSADGHYVLRLTADDGLSVGSRDVSVEVGAVAGTPELVEVITWGSDYNMLRLAAGETDPTPSSPVISASFDQRADLGLGDSGVDDGRTGNLFSPRLSGMIDSEGENLSTRVFHWAGEQIASDASASTGNRRIGPTSSYSTSADWRGSGSEQYQLYAWHRDDFLVDEDISLNDPEASLSVRMLSFTNNESGSGLRFVVKNGDTWYYSQAATTATGTFTLENPGTVQWAVFHPEALSDEVSTARSMAMPANASFSTVVLSEIQYIGFATEVIRTSNTESRQGFDNFVVKAMTAGAINLGPEVNAGTLESAVAGEPAPLSGTASDDGEPAVPGELVTEWGLESGPGPAVFADPAALETTVTFGTAGLHTLRLVADDGAVATFDLLATEVQGGSTPAPPPAPENLVAEAVSSSSITLSWTDPSDPADPAESFRVERSGDEGESWDEVATVDTPAHSDTGLAVHTWYSYRVRALRGGQESPPSAVAAARTWTVYEFPDDNDDGVDDNWIATYFPEADADTSVNRGNTTMTVRDIFIAGLDPEDENEVFEIGNLDPSSGTLEFDAKQDREYRILGTPVLGADADWEVLADWSVSPTLNLNGANRMFLKLQVRLITP